MEDIARLGDFALKLEKYRYNIATSISWIVFGGIFTSALLVANALLGILGFHPLILASFLIGSVVLSGYVYYKFAKLIGVRRGSKVLVVFATIFTFFYVVVPPFIKGNYVAIVAYYSTAWYPALGIAHVVIWYAWQRKDEDLVSKPALMAGILTLISSVPIMYSIGFVTDISYAMNLGFLTLGLMLAIYLMSGLRSFYKSYEIIFKA